MKAHYDVVVIGSGYGGAVAAARFARAGRTVCVLERGREVRPGDFPADAVALADEIQVDTPFSHHGRRSALNHLHVHGDLIAGVGCGLGGGSLINSGVFIRPDRRLFNDPRWPAALRDDLDAGLEQGYERARAMLRPAPYPDHAPKLPRLVAFERAAQAIGARAVKVPVAVNFDGGVNHVGVAQAACTLCGECNAGCNVGAKNTLATNYLPEARRHGAAFFTEVEVRRVERHDRQGRWRVCYQLVDRGAERFAAPDLWVSADVVIVAAGTFGSTSILWRSRAAGLPLSAQLGRRFSGNGGMLGFAYRTEHDIGRGPASSRPDREPILGTSITAMVDLRDQHDVDDGVVIEDAVYPRHSDPWMYYAFAAMVFAGNSAPRSLRALLRQARAGRHLLRPRERARAYRRTMSLLGMAHDDGAGRLELDGGGRLQIRWPGRRRQEFVAPFETTLRGLAASLGGSDLSIGGAVSVHPLGGCAMAERAEDGVVDHLGRVYAGDAGDAVHPGLYVLDGSIIPRSIGANPLGTITALAERNCRLIAQVHGWSEPAVMRRPAPLPPPPSVDASGLSFTERMGGHLISTVAAVRTPFELLATVIIDDVARMIADPRHRAQLVGCVVAPGLSADPLRISDGHIELLAADPDRVHAHRMSYRARLVATDGRELAFDGHKYVRPGGNPWTDTTKLHIAIHDGPEATAPLIGRGRLRIAVPDFVRQLSTLRVQPRAAAGADAPRVRPAWSSLMRSPKTIAASLPFMGFFADQIRKTYGGVLAPSERYDRARPPAPLRPLRAPAPTRHRVVTADGIELGLTRYRFGDGPPVALIAGLAMTNRVFTTDTIATNLVEHLGERGRDVWLVEWRTNPDLASSRSAFTIDDVARYDHPATLGEVLRVSGARQLDVVAHCIGSQSFLMSMLSGRLQQPGAPDRSLVRSAVLLQVGAHWDPPPLATLKAHSRLPDLLAKLGLQSLRATAEVGDGVGYRALDAALHLYPIRAGERCHNPTCRRAAFLYGELINHANLGAATHARLAEFLGDNSVESFRHLGRMTRAGHVVDADGGDVYLRDLSPLAIPITFVHGAESAVTRAGTIKRTYELLCAAHGDARYRWHSIDGYAHLDCLVATNVARDVFPLISDHLERQDAEPQRSERSAAG